MSRCMCAECERFRSGYVFTPTAPPHYPSPEQVKVAVEALGLHYVKFNGKDDELHRLGLQQVPINESVRYWHPNTVYGGVWDLIVSPQRRTWTRHYTKGECECVPCSKYGFTGRAILDNPVINRLDYLVTKYFLFLQASIAKCPTGGATFSNFTPHPQYAKCQTFILDGEFLAAWKKQYGN